MKKFDQEENEDFFEEEYFNFEELSFGEEKNILEKFLRQKVYLLPN